MISFLAIFSPSNQACLLVAVHCFKKVEIIHFLGRQYKSSSSDRTNLSAIRRCFETSQSWKTDPDRGSSNSARIRTDSRSTGCRRIDTLRVAISSCSCRRSYVCSEFWQQHCGWGQKTGRLVVPAYIPCTTCLNGHAQPARR